MTARGIRNRNPGNLEKDKKGPVWSGEVWPGDDKRFCTFQSMAWGCRAIMRTLRTYHKGHGLQTVEEIVGRWAPSNENDTKSYALHVASSIGRSIDERIPFDDDPTYYLAIAKAIARHECGPDAETISSDVWEEAYKLAEPLT